MGQTQVVDAPDPVPSRGDKLARRCYSPLEMCDPNIQRQEQKPASDMPRELETRLQANEWLVDLGSRAGEALGFEAVHVNDGLAIKAIHEGVLDIWNSQPGRSPEEVIREGDVIIVANGVPGDDPAFVTALRDADFLELILRRPEEGQLDACEGSLEVSDHGDRQDALTNAAEPEIMPRPVHTPDFSGEWLLSGTENMEAFLKDLGMSFMQRTFVRANQYGVGTCRQVIAQENHQCEVVSYGIDETTHVTYRPGAGKLEVVASDGTTVTQEAYWSEDSATLVVEALHGNGAALPRLERSLRGEDMLLVMRTANGVECSQRFSRHDQLTAKRLVK